MKLNKLVVGVMLATGATVVSAGEFKAAKNQSNVIKGQYVVVLKPQAVNDNVGLFSALNSSPQAQAQAQALAINMMNDDLAQSHAADVTRTFKHALQGGVYKMSKREAMKMSQDSRVAYIEEDFTVSINATQNNATWGLDRVDQANLPLNNQYVYDTGASNVRAYIIDTGVLNTHSDFNGRSTSGRDTVDNDNDATDCNGHGTHVAGTVASSTYGVAKSARIIGVRVLGCNGSGSNSGVIAGIDWVRANHIKPAVANMSLGGGASSATDTAVRNLHNAGVTVVVAAGNDNRSACNSSPAREPTAITVGSTASNDSRSSFSNFGTCLDIYAPGSSITSTWSNGGTRTISGTSMASPHVAGVAALYLADNPSATPAQVASAVLGNAVSGKVSDAKSGSPNLLLQSRFGGTPPPPPPPPSGGELTNGQAETGLSGSQGNEQFFTLEVPAGASNLKFQTSGGSGDADLYVRFGSKPTTATYDCRPYRNGNNETCDISNVQAGTYHVMVRAYSNFSGLSLVGSFDEGGTQPPVDDTLSESNVSGAQGNQQFFTLQVPAGRSSVNINISGGTGDADLYVRFGSNPTTSTYDCRPYRNGNSETCTLNAQAGTYYVMLRGYRAYSGVTLTGSSN